MKFTVLTPTYNRAKHLQKLYDSLKVQTLRDFEWIIIDDGSIDNTESVVNAFLQESMLDIKYYKKENGGKHTAINYGLDYTNGEFIFIVDSDDWLPLDSLKTAEKWIDTIAEDDGFVAVGGLRASSDLKYIGTTFDGDYFDCKSTERKNYGITGDKAEVFKAKILKQYRFPVFDGENFMTEAVVWNRLSLDGYKIRWFNEVIYYCNYLEGGLTNTKGKFYDNYNGFLESVKINQQCKEIPYLDRLKELTICCVYARKKQISADRISEVLNVRKAKIVLLGTLGSIAYAMVGGRGNG